ncbi:MAG: hypothetical protein WC890_07785 [Candidatus Margulisiibacteriota bacterium]
MLNKPTRLNPIARPAVKPLGKRIIDSIRRLVPFELRIATLSTPDGLGMQGLFPTIVMMNSASKPLAQAEETTIERAFFAQGEAPVPESAEADCVPPPSLLQASIVAMAETTLSPDLKAQLTAIGTGKTLATARQRISNILGGNRLNSDQLLMHFIEETRSGNSLSTTEQNRLIRFLEADEQALFYRKLHLCLLVDPPAEADCNMPSVAEQYLLNLTAEDWAEIGEYLLALPEPEQAVRFSYLSRFSTNLIAQCRPEDRTQLEKLNIKFSIPSPVPVPISPTHVAITAVRAPLVEDTPTPLPTPIPILPPAQEKPVTALAIQRTPAEKNTLVLSALGRAMQKVGRAYLAPLQRAEIRTDDQMLQLFDTEILAAMKTLNEIITLLKLLSSHLKSIHLKFQGQIDAEKLALDSSVEGQRANRLADLRNRQQQVFNALSGLSNADEMLTQFGTFLAQRAEEASQSVESGAEPQRQRLAIRERELKTRMNPLSLLQGLEVSIISALTTLQQAQQEVGEIKHGHPLEVPEFMTPSQILEKEKAALQEQLAAAQAAGPQLLVELQQLRQDVQRLQGENRQLSTANKQLQTSAFAPVAQPVAKLVPPTVIREPVPYVPKKLIFAGILATLLSGGAGAVGIAHYHSRAEQAEKKIELLTAIKEISLQLGENIPSETPPIVVPNPSYYTIKVNANSMLENASGDPVSATLAETTQVGDLSVPKDSILWLENRKLNVIFFSDNSYYHNIPIPKGSYSWIGGKRGQVAILEFAAPTKISPRARAGSSIVIKIDADLPQGSSLWFVEETKKTHITIGNAGGKVNNIDYPNQTNVQLDEAGKTESASKYVNKAQAVRGKSFSEGPTIYFHPESGKLWYADAPEDKEMVIEGLRYKKGQRAYFDANENPIPPKRQVPRPINTGNPSEEPW